MSAALPTLSRRTLVKGGGALFVSLAAAPRAPAQVVAAAERALGKTNDLAEVDAFIAIHADGSATLFCGKVDLGQGLRIAVRQMMAEELAMAPERIALVEGDSALTPDQGPTAGSTGIMRGGVQIRQAAATARAALVELAAERLGRPAAELDTIDGEVRPIAGGPGIGFGALIGDRRFARKLDARAKLRDPRGYRIVGKPLPRPDVPAKVTGRHPYVHDFKLPGMLHARVIRPAAVGARVARLDAASIAAIPGASVLRIGDFVAVVAEDEWACERARRALAIEWTAADTLVGHDGVEAWLRAGPFESDETITRQGDARGALAAATRKIAGRFYWPLQSHASMGPSCAVAELREGKMTVWSASQATHRLRRVLARILQMPAEAVRVVYLDGAGCYGMNGHDDASADAALIARATGRPVRVQWSRADEHGWDPKGPPQLLDIEATLDPAGGIGAWRTEMWLPKATANLPNIPLLGPADAGIAQPQGISTGLISQNAHPPYACASTEVLVHWLKDSPLRPSNIRAPGKVANTFAVESMVDDLAAAAGTDPVAFRLAGLKDPRGIEVIERVAKLIGWQTRPSPAPAGSAIGRGMAYVHYKFNETYVAIAMEASVDRASGAIRVHRIACAHDCGLIVNPDGAKQQIEGNIYQTLSRTLLEEVTFDRRRVTSIDWTSYPILAFPDVPELLIDLVDRPTEPPLGVGEAACSPVPAALANAIFDATGARLQTVPFTPDRVKRALATGRA